MRWLLVGAAVVVGYYVYEAATSPASASSIPSSADAILNAAQSIAARDSSALTWQGVPPAAPTRTQWVGSPPAPRGAPPAVPSSFVPTSSGPSSEALSGRGHF